jgi:hypothetical protein
MTLCGAVSAASASDIPWPQWAGLAAQSDAVVHGVCSSASSEWDESGRFIVTTVRLRMRRSFKGDAAGPLTVKVLGGSVDGVRMEASHGAALSEGEEAVLFLQQSQFGPYYVVAGGEAGKLPVQSGNASGEAAVHGTLSLDDFARGLQPGGGGQ